MTLANYQNIYFIGIGGIGMSALARYFKSRNLRVEGYDKTPSPLTDALQKEGISVHFIDNIGQISAASKNIETTLVVYTPAIPSDCEELNYFQKNGFDVYKRAQVLAAIANQGKSIAVGGTHGKTTTTSLIAHIYNQKKPVASAFLGGIAKNGETNFTAGSSEVVVLEADEFDRSFHFLEPHIALITSMDADHLDIYGTTEKIQEAFAEFAKRVRPNGKLIHAFGLPLTGITYGFDAEANYRGTNIFIADGKYHFTLHTPTGESIETHCGLPGRHNVENALGAAAACLENGLSLERVASGIASFGGVARRFDVHSQSSANVYIDDYAHHPQEIKVLVASVREMYPDKKITAIFQPHLFSRTRDFADGFAEELSKVDEIILLDIYPAREKPIPGVTADWLLKKITLAQKSMLSPKEVLAKMKAEKPEILLTIGAGDIDRMVEPLVKIMQS